MAEKLSVRKQIELKQLIDRELDGLYERASTIGRLMGEYFGEANKSQLRNLEAVAAAARRTSALKNHVKNQTGKDRGKSWAVSTGESTLGGQVLKLLEDLGGRASLIVENAKIEGSAEDRRDLARGVEIELQRGVVQTAVCAALYAGIGEAP